MQKKNKFCKVRTPILKVKVNFEIPVSCFREDRTTLKPKQSPVQGVLGCVPEGLKLLCQEGDHSPTQQRLISREIISHSFQSF